MSAIGTLVFCNDCGNLLPASKGSEKNILLCECCGAENKDAAAKTVITRSTPADFPSPLCQQLSSVQTVKRHELVTEALTQKTCEKCGRKEVRFSAVQLRSADEGSTIFYNCECGNRWAENN
ncbi:hypothetical protein RB597_006643 [Gaeumannomyces tritici]